MRSDPVAHAHISASGIRFSIATFFESCGVRRFTRNIRYNKINDLHCYAVLEGYETSRRTARSENGTE